jgi:hypothetical protein
MKLRERIGERMSKRMKVSREKLSKTKRENGNTRERDREWEVILERKGDRQIEYERKINENDRGR